MKPRIVVALIAVLMILAGAAARSTDYGPGPIVIDDTTKATNRYLGVGFDHRKHVDEVGLSCVMCHHTEKTDFVSGTPARCEACHNADAAISFKDAMHKRCVLCHIKKVREERPGINPPTQCLECHRQRH
jgi:hypothetical protein